MKVFISSVRRGLESERDSLPALIRAVGHEPVRFEDFSAQSVPSREACLQGVADSDVYLLLVGEHYGTTFAETGRSATEEEYVAAQAKGIPRLVFRKNNITPDPDQQRFIDEVELYGTGVFRDIYDTAVDLQPKVVAALKDVRTNPLEWHPLGDTVHVSWRTDWRQPSAPSSEGELEVHAVPIPAAPVARRQLAELPDELAGRLRRLNVVPAADPITTGYDDTAAWLTHHPPATAGWRQADYGGFAGCRVTASGQRSVWERLPKDTMGTVLDLNDLTERIARSLRLLGSIIAVDANHYALAVGLSHLGMATVAPVGQLGNRNSASGFGLNQSDIRVDPDEVVTPAALSVGSDEAARPLARQLLGEFTRNRGF